jgi:cell division control protein 45
MKILKGLKLEKHKGKINPTMRVWYLQLIQKRKRTLSKELVKTKKEKTLKREYQRLIQEYYSEGSYFGLAVVNTMYSLATQVGKVNNQYLWYTIVGMTSNYTYGKMNIIQYTQFASEYKEEVERLAIRTTIEDSQSILGSESRESHADDDSIKFIEDLQLVLLKHWNLYDSMFHSNYVATKLGVWKEKGRQAITNLLVQMGFPQKESKQFYREMSVDFKKDLKQTLMDLAPRYKMPNIVLPSFEKKYGYLVTLSASDVVYSLTALLDCGSTWLQKRGISGYEDVLDHSDASKMLNSREKEQFQERSHAREGGLVGAGVGTRSVPGGIATHILEYMSKLEIDERSDWVKHFYLAYDALEKYFLLTSPRIIQHGILLAIHYQRILVQTAISILDKRLVQTLGQFQLAILKPTNVDHMDGEDESKIFGTSIPMLHRLCVFLMDAFNVLFGN